MTESPEYKALLGEDEDPTREIIPGEVALAEQPEGQIPDPDQFPEPEELSEEDAEEVAASHPKDDVGGPGGVVNYDESLAPEDWEYVEGESTPPVEEEKGKKKGKKS